MGQQAFDAQLNSSMQGAETNIEFYQSRYDVTRSESKPWAEVSKIESRVLKQEGEDFLDRELAKVEKKKSSNGLSDLLEQLKGRAMVKGLEKETLDKQLKYQHIFSEQLENGDDITFTGMYKYVDSGLTNKFNLPIYKRKRVFRKINRVKKFLTGEQKEEIVTAFRLFDKDNSDTIDIGELKDAMRALGIFKTKQETIELMERIDKDGSGQLEKDEFIALMSEIM